jgi:CubicO group peptidase (beta-lactamase class C family)
MRRLIIIIALLTLTGCRDIVPVYSPAPEAPETITITTTTPAAAENPAAAETPLVTEPSLRVSPERLEAVNLDEVNEVLEAIAVRYNAVGMSVAVFANDEIIYTFNYGYADRANRLPVSDDTKFRSASVSKIITALSAMLLADSGELCIDAPISGILGFNMDYYPDTPNTTRHLMTHTSGITDTSAYTTAFSYSPPLSLPQMLNIGIWSADVPGTRYAYSNFASGLIAGVIESVTGERFYAFTRENLFDKLNIDAAYIRTLIQDTDNLANIYSGGVLAHTVRTWGRTENLYDKIPLGQSYGVGECELIISAPDLAKFGIILAGDGRYGNIRVLSEDAVREMNTVYITDDSGWSYGLGLRMSDKIIEGRVITGHPGQALGMVGGLYFDASDGTGAAILTNGCSIGFDDNGMYGINNAVVRAVYEHFFD